VSTERPSVVMYVFVGAMSLFPLSLSLCLFPPIDYVLCSRHASITKREREREREREE